MFARRHSHRCRRPTRRVLSGRTPNLKLDQEAVSTHQHGGDNAVVAGMVGEEHRTVDGTLPTHAVADERKAPFVERMLQLQYTYERDVPFTSAKQDVAIHETG